MRAELKIRNKYYPLTTELPVSVNLVLADIREPDKRNASFTKSINLNATNEINKLFENIFEVNIVTQVFNPNKKEDAVYYIDMIPVFSGKLQLLKVTLMPDGNIQYTCNIFGEGGSLFLDIGDVDVSALDFSAYNHTYNRDNQRASWLTPNAGAGYYYPFINYGTNGGSSTTFGVKDFKPAFFAREYLDKIITDAGYTWESTYFDSNEGKSLIVIDNNKGIPLSASQLADRQFYVGLSADYTLAAQNTYYQISYPNESAPFFDVGAQFTTNLATLNQSGNYNVAMNNKYNFSFTHTEPLVEYCTIALFNKDFIIARSQDGGASYYPIANQTDIWNRTVVAGIGNVSKFDVGVNYQSTSGGSTGDIFLSENDLLYAQAKFRFTTGIKYWKTVAGLPVEVTTGTGTPVVKLVSGSSGSSFYALATAKVIVEGNSLLANNCLPQKIKQKDFLKSIIQLFNLNIDVDKQNPKHLIIETWPDFYNQGVVNWENKRDLNKEAVVNPLAFIEGKRYIFKYKEDKDFYNTKYKDTYSETFGTHIKDIDNDFLKQDKTNEVIFSPTPNVANYPLGIAVPAIYKSDGVAISPETPNIRILIAGGVKSTTSQWNHTYIGTDLQSNDYGYAGHVDDPFNPTIDISFGIPKEVYYSYINAYFTDNNLFNRFHRPLINNITSRDSKIVTMWLWLTPKDINEFTFRKLYFIGDAYYIVNKIIDYNPLDYNSTKVELIKLLEAEVFTPTSTPIFDNPLFSGDAVETPNSNRSVTTGSNVKAYGNNVIAIGDNIYVPESSSNITVIGNNVTIGENLTNVSVINTNDITVTQSNYSIVNSVVMDEYFVDGYFTTTDDTPSEMTFNTPNGLFDLQSIDVVIRAEIRILAVDEATGDCKEWKGAKIIKNLSNVTSTNNIETVASIFSDASMTTATANMYDDVTPQSIEVGIQGIIGTTIQWKCYINFLKTII